MRQTTFSSLNNGKRENKKIKNRNIEPLLEQDINISKLIAEKMSGATTSEEALNIVAHIIIENFFSKKDSDSIFTAKRACVNALKRNMSVEKIIELVKKAKNPEHLNYLIEKEITGEVKKRTNVYLTKKEIAILREVFFLKNDEIKMLRKGELPQERRDELYDEVEDVMKKIDFTSCLKGMIDPQKNAQKFAFNVLLLRWGLDGAVPRDLKELASRYSNECYGDKLHMFNESKIKTIIEKILDRIFEYHLDNPVFNITIRG